jgi:hypothetical protein
LCKGDRRWTNVKIAYGCGVTKTDIREKNVARRSSEGRDAQVDAGGVVVAGDHLLVLVRMRL